MSDGLALQLLPLWPAGVGLALALGIAVSLPIATARRVWIIFFLLGTALPAVVALVMVLSGRVPAIVTRPIRWLGLLASAGVLVIGVGHGLYHHTPKHYAFEAVPALFSVIGAVFFVWVADKSEPRPGTIVRIGSVVIWLAVSLTAWGVAGSLLWWHVPGGFLKDLWLIAVLGGSLLVVLGALWRPNLGAGRLVGLAGTGLALLLLAVASVRTNDTFNPATFVHWEFYIGPAELVRQGGWLLWDVPAQYGFLSELTIAWIPTPSPWEGLFILNSVMSFLLAATVFVLLRSLGRGLLNLLLSFAVALVAGFLRPGFGSQLIGPIGYPSTGGFRFLWCVALLLILLLLVRVTSPRTRLAILVAGNLVWVAGVLWSAESAIYSTFVWLPGYFLMVVAERWHEPRIRRRLLSIAGLTALPVLFLAAAMALVVIVYEIGLGHAPDPLAFVEFGLTYQSGFGVWPIDPGGPGWVLLLAYVATLATLAWNHRSQPMAVSVALVATAAMIYATSSYFVGRSHPNAVWNLAPEVCIALALALALADRTREAEPVHLLLRLVAAPVFVVLIVGSLGEHGPAADYVLRPQNDITRIDAYLPATDPSLARLLDAHVKPGERVAYLAAGGDPVLSPYLFAATEQPDAAPLWLPLVPFSAVNILTPSRRALYLDRFMGSHPAGGWLIEQTGPQVGPQTDEEWVKQEISKRLSPGPSYSNADYVLTFWSANGSG